MPDPGEPSAPAPGVTPGSPPLPGEGSTSSPHAASTERPLRAPYPRRRPFVHRPPLAPSAPRPRENWVLGVKSWLWLAGVMLIACHLIMSRAEFTLPVRLLFPVPGLLFCAELHRYLSEGEKRELPFNVAGLFYFYVAFALPSFFNIPFFDLNGPVTFTEYARSSAGVAVSLGGLCLYGGMRAGEVLGRNLRPGMKSLLPPAELPAGFTRAVLWHGALAILLTMVLISAQGLIPGTMTQLLTAVVSVDLTLGLSIVRPEFFRGPRTRYTTLVLLLAGWSGGIIRGVLEPVFRLGAALFAGQWAYSRKVSLWLAAVGLGIYMLLQPIKHDFRNQVWGRAQVGYTERVEAWGFAFSNFFARDDTQEHAQDSTISRIAELDAVMHAFDMVPVQVQPLDGSGWFPILTAPIPRFIWRDKPTTEDAAEQRYAVIFHRQTDQGARTTAVALPLLVDGYWNFGWPGILFACSMVGLWVGLCQKLWSTDHWALEAVGITQFARLSIQAHLGSLYGGLFQNMVGLLIACWAIYWLAGLLSRTPLSATRRLAAPRVMRGRAPALPRPPSARG